MGKQVGSQLSHPDIPSSQQVWLLAILATRQLPLRVYTRSMGDGRSAPTHSPTHQWHAGDLHVPCMSYLRLLPRYMHSTHQSIHPPRVDLPM